MITRVHTQRSAARRLTVFFVAALACHAALAPAARAQSTTDLKRLSLEELLKIDVSTVSRTPEPANVVPAAVFVITTDDIRRSGATSVPEALRLAPGLQIARINAAVYSVGTRGFADRLSRAMLVMIDGRAVYSPLFAGTYWEVQDVMLEDVDRIEVIRGPGGTLWGANAVNGIINIITKKASATQGALASATVGSRAFGPFNFRYGGSSGSDFHYRVYAQATDRRPQFHADGVEFDEFKIGQAGFRGDWSLSDSSSLTLQGDAYGSRLGERQTLTSFTAPFSVTTTRNAPLSGGNVLMRWSTASFLDSKFQLQTYYDRTRRDEQPIGETRQTVDVDAQFNRVFGGRHDVIWGAGYRVTSGLIDATAPAAILPSRRTDNLVSALAQDDIGFFDKRLRLIAGAKIEHNDYTGVEVQPSARVVWNVRPTQTLIGSVTRAVRTPSRVETDYTTASVVPSVLPTFVVLQPNPEFKAEELIAYELGYRLRPVSRAYVTAATFYNDLQRTLSTDLFPAFTQTVDGVTQLILPVQFRNGLHGESHGVELTADVRPTDWWRWTANYSFLKTFMRRSPGSTDVSQERRYEGSVPRHQFQTQLSFDLPHRVSVDALFRHVSTLTNPAVPAYGTFTLRLGWQPRADLEIAVVGEDLNDAHHLEWPSGPGAPTEIARRAGVQVTWRR